jgi:hypothetical protein
LRDVAAGERNVLDRRANDVALGDGNDVRHTVARVDDGAGERALGDVARRPRRGQRQHGLNGNVQAGHVERLEHDLGRVFTVLGSVEWRLCEQKEVVLGLGAQVHENALFPQTLHQRPVLDLTVLHRIVHLVSRANLVGQRRVADVKVEVLDAGLGRRRLADTGALRLEVVGGDHRRNDVLRLSVASVAHLGVAEGKKKSGDKKKKKKNEKKKKKKKRQNKEKNDLQQFDLTQCRHRYKQRA